MEEWSIILIVCFIHFIYTEFDFPFNSLNYDLRQLLVKLTLFQSPFSISAVTSIFGFGKYHISQFYSRGLLTVINSDKYGDLEEEFWLYSFHPSIREYLEKKANTEGSSVRSYYYEKFSDYYLRFITDSYLSIGQETYFPSIRRFNIVMQSKNNDIHELKDAKQKAHIFRMLGAIFYSQGMYELSIEYYEQALDIHEEIGDKAAMADDCNSLGMVFYDSGRFNKSLKYLNKAIDICEEMRYTSQKADACNYAGTVFYSVSRSILHKHDRVMKLEKALQYQKTALKIHEETGHNMRAAIDCYNEALIFYDMKKFKKANEMLRKSRIVCLKQEEKTVHHYPLIDQINKMDSQLNKRNIRGIIRKKDLLNLKINKKRFLLNQLKWWSITKKNEHKTMLNNDTHCTGPAIMLLI